MSVITFMRKRLSDLKGRHFTRDEVTQPTEKYTEKQLHNALRSLVEFKSVIRVGGNEDGEKGKFQTAIYQYKRHVHVPKTDKSPWADIWPEFFNAPLIYGRCRANRLEG